MDLSCIEKGFTKYVLIITVAIFSTILLWSPFLLKTKSIAGIKTPNNNFETVLVNYDGPLYIIPAKTLYDKTHEIIQKSPLGLDYKYFAAHLPGYPITIRILSLFFNSYPKSMLLSTMITGSILFCIFYFILNKLNLTKYPLLLTFIFMFITPRFFVVRSIGAPEPLFILAILLSIFFFSYKKYFFAGLFGVLAAITKTPAILLFISYIIFIILNTIKTKKFEVQQLWILLIPIGFIFVFTLYYFQIGDFWAYFNSGWTVPMPYPFSVFNSGAQWVKTAWLEDILFIFFFYLYAIVYSFKNLIFDTVSEKNRFIQNSILFIIVFFCASLFVEHRDLLRYTLPMLPFTLIIFEKFFTSKKFIYTVILLLPAIYLYSWNFMLSSKAPIADWTPFL